jgi:hypothetical protein
MKFFSKFVIICNVCFLAMMVMQYINIGNKAAGKTEVALPLPFIEGTMAVLGLLSLLFNALFFLMFLILMATNKQIPRWIVWFNFIILAVQVYWLLIDKR